VQKGRYTEALRTLQAMNEADPAGVQNWAKTGLVVHIIVCLGLFCTALGAWRLDWKGIAFGLAVAAVGAAACLLFWVFTAFELSNRRDDR
jgi:hypothetical protein